MIEHGFYSGQTQINERGGVSHGDKMSLTQSKQSWRLLVDSNERVCDCGEVQLFVVPRQFIQQVAWQSTIDHSSVFFVLPSISHRDSRLVGGVSFFHNVIVMHHKKEGKKSIEIGDFELCLA